MSKTGEGTAAESLDRIVNGADTMRAANVNQETLKGINFKHQNGCVPLIRIILLCYLFSRFIFGFIAEFPMPDQHFVFTYGIFFAWQ
ncbi:MAG: hypothetical protein LBV02_00035 [Bacteroidales bacterium]|nr:hypothetical protein [Bacteroidales bacterium]